MTSVHQKAPKSSLDHQWKIIPEVISCIEQGGNVAALLHPLAEEAKARISIKPVRLRKSSIFLPRSVPASVRRGR